MLKWISMGVTIMIITGCINTSEIGSIPTSQSISEETQAESGAQTRDTSEKDTTPRIIEVDASRFQFTPEVITVKQGENVMLRVTNTDTLHGIALPYMEVVEDSEVTLDTSTKGEYPFFCATFCGQGHGHMTGKIIIQ